MSIGLIGYTRESNRPEPPSCEGITYGHDYFTNLRYYCCVDCKDMGHQYLEYISAPGGIGRSAVRQCYCRNNSESIKIYGT